jgi:hypothetical protein
MKLKIMSAALAAVCLFAHSAQAQAYEHEHSARSHRYYRHASPAEVRDETQQTFGWKFFAQPQPAATASHVGGRPSRWCGWEMRQLVGSDPGTEYNLARNWARWGAAGPAGVGAVVVWPHHVGKIVGQENGQWLIESGNDGHAVRTRARSLAGVIAVRWG